MLPVDRERVAKIPIGDQRTSRHRQMFHRAMFTRSCERRTRRVSYQA